MKQWLEENWNKKKYFKCRTLVRDYLGDRYTYKEYRKYYGTVCAYINLLKREGKIKKYNAKTWEVVDDLIDTPVGQS